MIVAVEDDAALDDLLAADPYPKDSYAVSSRRPWTPLFDVTH